MYCSIHQLTIFAKWRLFHFPDGVERNSDASFFECSLHAIVVGYQQQISDPTSSPESISVVYSRLLTQDGQWG